MKKITFFLSMLMLLTISTNSAWGAVSTKTEGFEAASTGTNYQSTVTVNESSSDCGIGWEIYYGTISTSSKIAGNNSAALRLYTTANYGYLKTTTAINGLTQVSFKAKAATTNSASIKIDVKYSTDGTNWSPMKLTSASGSNYTAQNVASSATSYTAYIPTGVSGDIYFQIAINSGSTKPSSKNAQLTIDDVVFTYTPAESGKCSTPAFSPVAGTYEGTQNVTITSTEGATIYFTTDGSNPTTSSNSYSAPISVSTDMTIKAYAVKSGWSDSEIGEASYTITKGADVILNLIDGKWDFPVSDGKTLTSYTNSETGYTISCYAQTEYKISGSSYFYIGKSGSYITLPKFSSPVEKIVVVGNSGGSGSVIFNIFDGDDPVSTAATGCTTDKTFEIEDPAANKQYTLKVTSNHNLQLKAIKFYFGEAPAVAKPTISGEENFVGSTSVTISQADADHVYYTTDNTEPTTSSTEYTAPFTLTNTTTVKAIAVKDGASSAVAEKTFTKVEALETMAALLEATTSTETAFNVVISNWVVTAVNGSRAWIADADNTKGILLYKSSHGFTVGKKLNGVVIGTKAKLYQGYPELTTLVSSEVTVTNAEAVTPRTTTIAALASGHNVEQGTIVKLENVTYAAATTGFSDGNNTIGLNTQLYTPTMVDGAIYTIIGVVRYDNNAAISIMPRSADDVEQISSGSLPEVDGLAALKANATGASYLVNLTNAVVTLVDGSNAFIEDATAGALIYFSGHGYAAGDKLNGQYEVTTATYQGKFEITAMEAQTGATKTADAEIPVTTLTIAQLNANFAANESKRIKITEVNVTDAVESGDATARTGEISDGENTITLYAGKSGVTAAENANIDVIGYPTFHNTNQQLAVWAQADITVNSSETPIPEGAENVVIIAEYDSKYYAMSTTNSNNAFTAIAVEYNGTQVTVNSAEDKAAIQWTKTTDGDNTTFQDASGRYLKGTSSGASVSLDANACNWSWDATNEYYYIPGSTIRSFFYKNDGIFKNYAVSNLTNAAYAGVQVIAIAAENIVINSKVSAELAYSPASVELTVGDEFTPATLTYAQGFDGLAAVTYESSNTNLAIVEGGVVSLVADATGTATITATFAGNNNYQAGSASYTITVNAPAPIPSGTTYRKVTATADITDGEYLIVYETTSVAFNGALETLDAESNSVVVTINEGVIAGTTAIDAAVFTIDATAGTLQSASGKYIGVSSNSNGLKQTEDATTYTHIFSIDDDENAVILANFEGSTMKLRYNPSTSAGNLRFRYYKNDGQQAIQLYKKESAEPVEPDYTEIRTGLTAGSWGTFCYNQDVEHPTGASFFTIAYVGMENGVPYKVFFDEIGEGESLQAGQPYVYIANDDAIKGVPSGDPVAEGINDHGFIGVLSDFKFQVSDAASQNKYYVIYDNQIRLCDVGWFKLLAGRAYIDVKDPNLPTQETAAPAPGRRRISLSNPQAPQTATGIDAIESNGKTVKVMIGEQLFILRDGKLYDTTGRLVK